MAAICCHADLVRTPSGCVACLVISPSYCCRKTRRRYRPHVATYRATPSLFRIEIPLISVAAHGIAPMKSRKEKVRSNEDSSIYIAQWNVYRYSTVSQATRQAVNHPLRNFYLEFAMKALSNAELKNISGGNGCRPVVTICKPVTPHCPPKPPMCEPHRPHHPHHGGHGHHGHC